MRVLALPRIVLLGAALIGLAGGPVPAAPPKKKAPAKKAAPKKAAPKKAPAKPAAVKPKEPQTLNLGSVTGELPGEWTSQAPIGQFRLAQYAVPKAAGDTATSLLIVFHFGRGGGGSVEDNVTRWIGMMKQPEGTDPRKAAKRALVERDGLRVTTLDIPGTYLEKPFPMAERFTERPNYRMLAAIIETTRESGDGPYYVRLVGPARSVDAARSGWDGLIKSLKAQ